jgi:DNA-binding helix-hairpin-helix protein with protein kinase domain
MWLAVDRNGTKYIVDELFTTGSPEEMVALIRAKEQETGWNIRMRIIDPMAYVPDQNKDMPILQEQLAKLGLYFEKASKDLSSGILRVQQALSYGVEDSIIVKAPELYVFNTCTRTDWEFKRYIWDEWSPIMQDRRQPKKKPRDKDDHMMECLYRLMLLEPRYLDPTTESPVMFETNEFTGY